MYCPECHSNNVYAIDSRSRGTNATRRRRKCLDCGKRFSTIEVILDSEYFDAAEEIPELVRLSSLAVKFAQDVAKTE